VDRHDFDGIVVFLEALYVLVGCRFIAARLLSDPFHDSERRQPELLFGLLRELAKLKQIGEFTLTAGLLR
jgi:hypothetical protein